jgi:fructuronate reductase
MTLPRLSRDTLARLPYTVRRPEFDARCIATGIVHLGIGAFARAHLARYTQPLLADDPRWGILGVSLRSAVTRDALAPQDWLYTCVDRDGSGERLTAMASLTGVLVAPEDPGAVVVRLADPAVRIVTLSVTEKGYHRLAAQGALDEDDVSIRHDLAHPDMPRTVPGLLVTAIRARRDAGVPPFTVLCLDNLPENGDSTRRVVARFAELIDPALGRRVADDVAFPNCMVDRIVPATTDADRQRIDALSGVHDAWPVVCEPFSQWVIEDRFPLGRPLWERTGAELVDDVRPYETMKLRLLNGSHSCIAYLGQLAGWQTVAEAIAEPALASFIDALMQEVATTLRVPVSVDLAAYRRAMLARFGNLALRHRTAQIAMDGSQKLPQRLFATAQDRLAQGLGAPCTALGTAAWLRFLHERSDDGSLLTVDDPKKETLLRAVGASSNPHSLCEAIFAMHDVVPPGLANSNRFRNEVLAALEELTAYGVRKTLIKINRGEKRHDETPNGTDSDGRAVRGSIAGDGAGGPRRGLQPADGRDTQGRNITCRGTGERALAGRDHHRRR